MNKPTPLVHRMPIGSRGHSKTLEGVAAYHAAKKAGKTCMIVAKNEGEQLRLVVNHHIDPTDIVLKVEADMAGKAVSDSIYKRR